MNFNGEPFLCHVPIAQQQRTEKPEQKLASKEDAINRVFLLDNVCHYRVGFSVLPSSRYIVVPLVHWVVDLRIVHQ